MEKKKNVYDFVNGHILKLRENTAFDLYPKTNICWRFLFLAKHLCQAFKGLI